MQTDRGTRSSDDQTYICRTMLTIAIAAFLTASAGMLALTTFPMPSGTGVPDLIPVIGLLACGAVTGFSAVMAFRGYFHSLKVLELEEKLRSTNFEDAKVPAAS